ncbi:MAG TPA: 2-oxoglutarate synthase [Planctomycetes bacterium]|nr:2-oxoglutarate synthase [Planctomycetota bacterium]
MSATDPTQAIQTLRNDRPYPFCPGCGHGSILNHLNEALVRLQLPPNRVVIVSDIGCSGLSDQYFTTSAFHGLHGRSLTYATGIKLARPDLKVVVLMGDGGAGIGGAHLINAARRNIGLTLLVMNNFNFGMTGGQHSVTTPTGYSTSTTPGGNLERPLDICGTVQVNGAGYVYRGTNFDKDLTDRMVEAMEAECFALLDIWDLCTAYFVPRNQAGRKTLAEILGRNDFESGLLHEEEVPEYAAAYRDACSPHLGKPTMAPQPLEPRFESALDRRFRFVVAGSAGGKVISAVRFVAKAAILSGLWATQRDDYPITVKSGHSLSELNLDPEEILYTGISRPDALLILSDDGLGKVGHHLAAMGPDQAVFALPRVEEAVRASGTEAAIHLIDPAEAPVKIAKTARSLYAVTRAVDQLGFLDPAALEAAVGLGRAAWRDENLATVRAARTAAG